MLALKTFKTKAQSFSDLLNYAATIENGIVLNKDGSLMVGWYYKGHDMESATSAERNNVSVKINMALSKLGTGWMSHHDSIRFETRQYPDKDNSFFPDWISESIDQERRDQFETRAHHYESIYTMVLTYMPPTLGQSKFTDLMLNDQQRPKSKPFFEKIIDEFKQKIMEIEDILETVLKLERMTCYSYQDQWHNAVVHDRFLQHLHFCILGENHPINLPSCPMYLDSIIGSYEFHTGIVPKLDNQYIMAISIDGFPSDSVPNILHQLDQLPITFRWNTRFIYMDQMEAESQLNKYRRKWKQKVRGIFDQIFNTSSGAINQDALAMVDDVESAISETNSQLVSYGYYTSTIILMGEDIKSLEQDAKIIRQIIQNIGFSCRIETVNTIEAYLGSLPGHGVPNIRRPLINTLNLADLLPTHTIWSGDQYNPCEFYPEQSPALMYGSAEGTTPFRLNLHVRDVGHTLIFGPTGSGKSTLLALIAAQFRRYKDAKVFAFDKGMSLYALTEAVNGVHYNIAGEQSSPCFCPLAEIDSVADFSWAVEWVLTLIELQNVTITPRYKTEITKALQLLQQSPTRTLTELATTLQEQELRDAISHYTISGPMGHLLDSESDDLAVNSFQVFEIESLMHLGDENIIPVLLYLFYQIEKQLKGQPSLLILDEAWLMLGHRVFKEKIREWLKVLRKSNCAVVMATQSISDAAGSGIIDVLNESCPTKIYLPNSRAKDPSSRKLYEELSLNERQLDIITHSIPKRDYYYVSPEGRRLFNLNLGPLTLAFVAASGKADVQKIQDYKEQFQDQWPKKWLSYRGVQL